jgi:parallel beta-helix repeat protein
MNMSKLTSRIVTMILVVAALAAFTTSASADGNPGAGCPCDTELYGTINGEIYFEQQGYSSVGHEMQKTFTNVPSGIKYARVYTGVWQGSPGKGGYYNITIENTTGIKIITDTYKACDSCPTATGCLPCQPWRCDVLGNSTNIGWNGGLDLVNMHDYTVGCGVQFISYNATPYINPGQNTITVKTDACPDCYRGGWDGRIYLIALLVVYENQDMPEITYWVNEGGLYLEKGSACDGPTDHLDASKYFNGSIGLPSMSRVKLYSLGWPHVINGTTKLNTHDIGTPDITESHGDGYNEVMLRWTNINTGFVSGSSQYLTYHDDNPLYERAFVEALIIRGPSDKPNLVVPDIQFPPAMRPSKTHTVTATVENQGDPNQSPNSDAGPFDVGLYVDGSSTPVSTYHVSSGLAAGASNTTSFSVSLAEGCHEFRVMADCNGAITEDNEFDNKRTEEYQVGNVIVVKSNSDFDIIVTESTAGELPTGSVVKYGSTYYIQDLDITNCAGNGITIKNTNVPFVIRRCTVHDCMVNGILFDNVAGTAGVSVYENEVMDNDMKGIKVVNSSYVVIDSNYAHDNDDYGIDVYMAHMPTLDSHHITISNNTVEHNAYGIELMGCNCDVRCNTIINNEAFGGGEEGYGIYCSGTDNVIYDNSIKYNDNYGIYLDDTWITTDDNKVYGNDLIANNQLHPDHTSQAFDNGANYWDSITSISYYYNGNTYSHRIGNYWGDNPENYGKPGHNDPDGDGIGETPYSIDGGTGAADSYPRIVPWWVCGDVDGKGGPPNWIDYLILRLHIVNPIHPPIRTSTWAADVNCNGLNWVDYLVLRLHVVNPTHPPLGCCEGCCK